MDRRCLHKQNSVKRNVPSSPFAQMRVMVIDSGSGACTTVIMNATEGLDGKIPEFWMHCLTISFTA